MPLDLGWMPLVTPIDPSEDPPGSVDPLGTLADAERLVELLLPGFTVRMWRARLLTVTTVAAEVADRAVTLMDRREDLRLEARLAFERLYVAAVVRLAIDDPTASSNAALGVPGRTLAQRALQADEPVTKSNFLKGQAVNGAFGVMARLARHLQLIGDDGRPGAKASKLLLAWAEDEDLNGILDPEGAAGSPGAAWMAEIVKATAAGTNDRTWPAGRRIWERLAKHLRADQSGRNERRAILELLRAESSRRRVFELLEGCEPLFRDAQQTGDRRGVERSVLLKGVRPALDKSATDAFISAVVAAIDAYERGAGLLQQVFDGLLWGVHQRGGRARSDVVLRDARVGRHLERTLTRLAGVLTALERASERLRGEAAVEPSQVVEPLMRLREDLVQSSGSVKLMVDAVWRRHDAVQLGKKKAPWVERDVYWTLMPGQNRFGEAAPPSWEDVYLHPMKVRNAYALLKDLGRVTVQSYDGED